MRAIIHIGDQKNGSKAYQCFLNDNRTRLLENGFLVPVSTKITGHGYDSRLAAVAGDVEFVSQAVRDFQLSSGASWAIRKKVRQELEREIGLCGSEVHTLLMSFEGLAHLSPAGIGVIADLFKGLAKEFLIICSFRRQDRKLCSGFSTGLLHGLDWVGCHPFTDKNGNLKKRGGLLENLSYSVFALNWQSQFGFESVDVFRYEDIAADVLAGLWKGIPSLLSFLEKSRQRQGVARINRGLSFEAQSYIYSFNNYLKQGFLPEFSGLSQNELFDLRCSVSSEFVGKSFLPARRSVEEFYFSNFSDSNKGLSRVVGAGSEDFFDHDFSSYPEDMPGKLELQSLEAVRQVFGDLGLGELAGNYTR